MWSKIGSTLLGTRLPSSRAPKERLSNIAAMAILSSDVLSSVAYATEELLVVLVLGGTIALQYAMPISIVIVALLAVLVTSYQQLVRAYPGGGGAYTVAKENLGERAGLVAASGLLIDYILTVSVSIAAGVDALSSAFPKLAPYSIELALLFLAALMLGNLRGVREAGRFFTLPTLLFIASMFLLIAVGIVKYALGQVAPASVQASTTSITGNVSIFLLLRAFASGCTALTGTEAISNGVRVFKSPEPDNARKTMLYMGVILGIMFLGITFLSSAYNILPSENQTVVSQLAHLVVGNGFLYYLVQFSTLLILIMAANTSFSDFPRVASMLGRDGYLPRMFSDVGSRLVYSNGIIILALLSAALIAVFEGNLNRLIPLYAVGVFMSFTLSQAGMVQHWRKHRGPAWARSILINAVGAAATALALAVIVATKFTHGAWFVTLLVLGFLYLFSSIHRHYQMVADELSLQGYTPPPVPRKHTIVIPVSGVHRAVLKAIAYAKVISTDVRAVYIGSDPAASEALRRKWQQYVPDVPLDIINSPYRIVISEFTKSLDRIQEQEQTVISVVIPEFVPMHWWEFMLHRQTALMLKATLLFRKGIPVISIPHHLRR